MWNMIKKLFSGITDRQNKGVSEPVISFIKCFKENPKRFTFKLSSYNGVTCTYLCKDTLTQESWEVKRGNYKHDNPYKGFYQFPAFLTPQETFLLFNTIYDYLHSEKLKLEQLEGVRRQRVKDKERKRLIEVYKCTN